jgi:DNA-binding transcriptional ArsR family regulator
MVAPKIQSKDPPSVKDLLEVDRVIHEPARLAIVAALAACDAADFVYLRNVTDLTQGNLSAHLAKLEQAGYVSIEKRFQGKKPNTLCRLTDAGRAAFKEYRVRVGRLINPPK